MWGEGKSSKFEIRNSKQTRSSKFEGSGGGERSSDGSDWSDVSDVSDEEKNKTDGTFLRQKRYGGQANRTNN